MIDYAALSFFPDFQSCRLAYLTGVGCFMNMATAVCELAEVLGLLQCTWRQNYNILRRRMLITGRDKILNKEKEIDQCLCAIFLSI